MISRYHNTSIGVFSRKTIALNGRREKVGLASSMKAAVFFSLVRRCVLLRRTAETKKENIMARSITYADNRKFDEASDTLQWAHDLIDELIKEVNEKEKEIEDLKAQVESLEDEVASLNDKTTQ